MRERMQNLVQNAGRELRDRSGWQQRFDFA
jgi:hypothetical protein